MCIDLIVIKITRKIQRRFVDFDDKSYINQLDLVKIYFLSSYINVLDIFYCEFCG